MTKTTDLERLQGSWRVTALEVDGQPMTAEMLAGSSVAVKGKHFTGVGMGAKYKGVLVLDATDSPHRIDMKFDAGPGLRIETPFGLLRIDVGYQLNRIEGLRTGGQPERHRWRINVGVGEAF